MLTVNGRRLVEDRRLTARVLGNSIRRIVKLYINNIAPNDEGTYTCEVPARSPVSADVMVTVTTRRLPFVQPTDQSQATPLPLNPTTSHAATPLLSSTLPSPSRKPATTVVKSKPRITEISSDSDVQAGSTAVLTCIARDIGNLNVSV